MCDLMKVQSSFRFKGNCYKVHFVKKDGHVFPVVKKLVGSVFGVKIWRQRNAGNGATLSNTDVTVLKESKTLKVIDYLREFAQTSMGQNVHIV